MEIKHKYRRRRLRDAKKINFTHEYDHLLGELTQTTIDAGPRKIEARQQLLNATFHSKERHAQFYYLNIKKPDIYGIKYMGLKPRPTYERAY